MDHTAHILLNVPSVRLMHITDKATTQISMGELEIAVLDKEGVFFIKMGDFVQSLQKNMPMYVSSYPSHRAYLFPIQGGFQALMVDDTYRELYETLELILDSATQLIYKDKDGPIHVQITPEGGPTTNKYPSLDNEFVPKPSFNRATSKPIFDSPVVRPFQPEGIQGPHISNQKIIQPNSSPMRQFGSPVQQPMSQRLPDGYYLETAKEDEDRVREPQEVIVVDDPSSRRTQKPKGMISKLIFGGGALITAGLVAGSRLFARGIHCTGEYIEKNIDQGEEIVVPEYSKKGVQMLQNASDKVYNLSAGLAENIVNMNYAIAHGVMKVFGIKNNKDDDENPGFFKDVTKSSALAVAQIVEGLDAAATVLGESFGMNAKKITHKKYGKEASELVHVGYKALSNVGATFKNVESLGVKALARTTGRMIVKEYV